MKSFFAMLLALCLMCSTAGASGLDRMLGGYIDENHDVRYAMSARIDSLTPYGENTIAMLNGVLKHMSISAALTDDETVVDVCVSGDSVMSLTEKTVENGTELVTPLLPNRTLVSSGSALDSLTGANQTTPKFDLTLAIPELEGCYQALTDSILPYAEEKKANYKIKNVAHSKWSRIARLNEEQGKQIAPFVEAVLACGMDEAYRQNLQGLQLSKGFVVGLYQLKEGGEDVAVYMKGYVTLADGVTRALSFQWAFAQKDDGTRVDTLKYELTKSKKAASTREINASLQRRADTQLLFKGECEIAIKDDDGNVTTIHTYDVSGKEKGNVRPIQGDVSLVTKVREGDKTVTETTALALDLKITASEGSGVLSGSVGVEQKTGKVVHMALTLLFDEEPAQLLNEAAESGVLFAVVDHNAPESSLSQNAQAPEKPEDYLVGKPPIGLVSYTAPEAMQVINLDQTADTDALMNELAQNLAGKLLIALTKIPEEDAALLRDNLSDTDYATFLEMVDNL